MKLNGKSQMKDANEEMAELGVSAFVLSVVHDLHSTQ
jgi:hypothetical protein